MLVDNSLSGPIGAQPSNTQLASSARVGTVTVDAPARASYEATQLVHGLTTVEVSTGYARDSTPAFEVALPATGPWAARWYVWMPALQDAGLGTAEVRWHCAFPDAGLGLVVHATAAGNVGTRLQPDDLDASAIAWDSEAGSAVATGQWWRIELTYDGSDLVCSTYAGHATTGARVHTWLGRDVGRTLRVGGYRYRRGAFLPYGNGSFDQEVQDYQNDLIDLGYPAPLFGADGFYGDEMADQLDGFAGDHGMGDLVGTFGSGGGAGAEVLAAIDLAWAEDQAAATPPPVYLSHLGVDTTAVGPAAPPSTSAGVAATGTVGSTEAKHTATTATVAGVGSATASVSKHTGVTASVAATGSIGAEVSSQHLPTFPPALTVELKLDEEWVDITRDVRATEDLGIRRGRADEAAQADPSSLSLLLNNRHGKYSPRNPLSPYYGQIGRNTPIRVRAGALPDPGVTLLADTFDREVVDGWGTADTGQVWEDPFIVQPDYSVSGGAGRMHLATTSEIGNQITTVDMPADFDATFTVSVDQAAAGVATGAIFASLRARYIDGGNHIRFNIGLRVDTGKVDGTGLRVTTNLIEVLPATSVLAPLSFIPGLVYTPGQFLRVRCQAVGPEMRVRVWADGTPEPTVWHSQGYTQVLDAGRLGLRASVDAGAAASMPVVVSFADLVARTHVAPGSVVRYVGEVSSWPPRWDTSDSDIWVPVQAAGILRRLGQGQKPLQSPLRRTLPTELPPAYWPLEDGADTTRATSVVEGVPPLQVEGLRFGEDDTLISSDPLPVIGPGGARVHASVATADTGSWEVDLVYNLEFLVPTEDPELLGLTTSTARWSVFLGSFDDRPTLWVRVSDFEGATIFEWSAFVDVGDVDFFDAWRRLRVMAFQDGSDVSLRVDRIDDENNNWGFSESYSGTVGHVTGIDTTFGAELEDMGVGHISVWGVRFATAYFTAFGAHRRTTSEVPETTRERLNRLETDAGVPILVEGAADTELGAQEPGTFLDAVTAAQAADLGVPGEQRHQVGLSYRGRDTLYNQTPVLVLDYANGEISPPVEPQDDDQNLRNDVEVKRSRGATVSVVDEDGPLGINTVGRYDESTTLTLASDAQLPDQAGWRLHLGTVDELRWPVIRVNLANPRMRTHIEAILNLDPGDRIRILNPPAWTQTQDLDLIVQGYEERIGAYAWELLLTCTPASPWIIGEVAAPGPACDADVEASATTTVTVTGAGVGDTLVLAQLWDWDSFANMPDSPTPGTWALVASATVEADTPHVKVWTSTVTTDGDQEVTVPIGAGVDPDNHAHLWLLPNTDAGDVVAAAAVEATATTDHVAPSVTLPDPGVLLCGWLGQDALGEYTLPGGMAEAATTGGGFSSTAAASEWVEAGASGTRTATYPIATDYAVYTIGVPLVPSTAAPDRADTAGSELAFDIDAVETTLAVATTVGPAWVTSAGHPGDFPFDITIGGEVMRVVLVIGDGSSLPQTVEVTRAVNGVVKSHQAGADVRLTQPATAAL